MFGHAIGGRARLGRQAMLALVWILLLIALALATLANLATARAHEIGSPRPTVAGDACDPGRLAPGQDLATAVRPEGLPARGLVQPALSNQNVSGR